MEAKITITMTFDDYHQFKTTMNFFERCKKTIDEKGEYNFTSDDYALLNFIETFMKMSKV